MKVISVADLKARLSEQLRIVKQGGRVLVTDRGRPVAMLVPCAEDGDELAALEARGLVRRGQTPLAAAFWRRARPADPTAAVRTAVSEDRESGW